MSKKRIQSIGSYKGPFCRYKTEAQRRRKSSGKYLFYELDEIVNEIKEEERLKKEEKRLKDEIYKKMHGHYPSVIYTGQGGMKMIQGWLKEKDVSLFLPSWNKDPPTVKDFEEILKSIFNKDR